MAIINVSNEEYEKLVKTLNSMETTRNNLLTFSFTAVLTILGVAIGIEDINPLICLLPFFLIIPFAARISYYRLATAHINSFLEFFAPERMFYMNGKKSVPAKYGKLYPFIAWLVNYEMFLLSLTPTICFWWRCASWISEWAVYHVFLLAIPFPCLLVVFLIANSTFNYKKLSESYEWEDCYKEKGIEMFDYKSRGRDSN